MLLCVKVWKYLIYFTRTNNLENIEAEAICAAIACLLVAPHAPLILDLRRIWQHLLENGWKKVIFSPLAYLTPHLE